MTKGINRIMSDRQLQYCSLGGFLYYGLMIWTFVGGMLVLLGHVKETSMVSYTGYYGIAIVVGLYSGSYLSKRLMKMTDHKVNILIIAYGVQFICLMVVGFTGSSAVVLAAMLICGGVLGIDWKVKLNYIEERTDQGQRKAVETAYFFICSAGGFIGLAVFNRLAVRLSVSNVFIVIGFASLLLFPILRKLSEREAEEKGWSNFDGM